MPGKDKLKRRVIGKPKCRVRQSFLSLPPAFSIAVFACFVNHKFSAFAESREKRRKFVARTKAAVIKAEDGFFIIKAMLYVKSGQQNSGRFFVNGSRAAYT